MLKSMLLRLCCCWYLLVSWTAMQINLSRHGTFWWGGWSLDIRVKVKTGTCPGLHLPITHFIKPRLSHSVNCTEQNTKGAEKAVPALLQFLSSPEQPQKCVREENCCIIFQTDASLKILSPRCHTFTRNK